MPLGMTCTMLFHWAWQCSGQHKRTPAWMMGSASAR